MTLGLLTPLRLLCLQHGMTRRQVAELAGISVRTLYNIEGGHPIADETIVAIAAALGEPPIYVVNVLSGRIKLEVEIREVAA